MVERLSVLREGDGGRVKEAEPLLTAPRVWAEIINGHPEILQTEIVSYPRHSHGEWPGDYYDEFVPVGYLNSTLAQGDWPRRLLLVNEIIAVGAVVDVCNEKGCSHGRKEHQGKELQIWEYWHDGLAFPRGESLSFVFLDIEWHNPAAFRKVLEVLREADVDWYAFDSGGGYHIILDELVTLASLPGRYGEIVTLFGEQLHNPRLKGWGSDLIRNGRNQEKVMSWCRDVLENCGHIDEPIGRETHIIDLRHVAHSLRRLAEYRLWLDQNPLGSGLRNSVGSGIRMGGPYLRISPGKNYSSPPVLVAKQSSGELALFTLEERPLFQRPAIQRAWL